MNYFEQSLSNPNEQSHHQWCVVRHLSNFQSIVLTYFSSRAEAEARVRFLNRAHPTAFYEVVFNESIAPNSSVQSRKDAENQDF